MRYDEMKPRNSRRRHTRTTKKSWRSSNHDKVRDIKRWICLSYHHPERSNESNLKIQNISAHSTTNHHQLQIKQSKEKQIHDHQRFAQKYAPIDYKQFNFGSLFHHHSYHLVDQQTKQKMNRFLHHTFQIPCPARSSSSSNTSSSLLLYQPFQHYIDGNVLKPIHPKLVELGRHCVITTLSEHYTLHYPYLDDIITQSMIHQTLSPQHIRPLLDRSNMLKYIWIYPKLSFDAYHNERLIKRFLYTSTYLSLIGAISTLHGIDTAQTFVRQYLMPYNVKIHQRIDIPNHTAMHKMNMLTIQFNLTKPYYKLNYEYISRLHRENTYTTNYKVGCYSSHIKLGQGSGRTIKQAQRNAAKQACLRIYATKVKPFDIPPQAFQFGLA